MIQLNQHGNFKYFLHNLPLIISYCAFVCLTVNSIPKAISALLAGSIILLVSFHIKFSKDILKNTAKTNLIPVMLLLLFLGENFYSNMIYSSKLKAIADMLHIPNQFLVFLLTCIGAIAASCFFFWIIEMIGSDYGELRLKSVIHSNHMKKIALGLALLGMILTMICSFNGSIWADEAYSLRIIQYNYKEIIAMCAADVHPPFYYISLKLFEDFLRNFFHGYYASVVIAKLFSASAYVLLSMLCWYKLQDQKNIRPLILLCIYGIPPLFLYAFEIRMYSWALLFVTASFLYARDLMLKNPTKKPWIFLTLFSILSAYTHTFALIAMASVWLYLFIWICAYDRQKLPKWFFYGGFVGILFFPWIIVLFRQVGNVAESYWIDPITWSNIIDFIKFIFPKTLLFIPLLLLIKFPKKGKTDRKLLLESAFGILIPLTTLIIGICVSVIIRPVFVSRYLIPGILCLWISILFVSKKCNYKTQALIVLLLIINSVNLFYTYTKQEFISKQAAEDNIALINSLEENAIVIISCNTHTSDVVAAYTDHMVYNWNGPELTTATTKYREAYKNEDIFDDISQVSKWLNDGISLYYIETVNSQENERLPIQEEQWNIELIGEYDFEQKTHVYKIIERNDL